MRLEREKEEETRWCFETGDIRIERGLKLPSYIRVGTGGMSAH